jgi:hypothetical protein
VPVSDQEFIEVRQTPEQLVEQAEQDANTARLAWRKAAKDGILTTNDVVFCEMLLHQADVSLRLADAKVRLGQHSYRG